MERRIADLDKEKVAYKETTNANKEVVAICEQIALENHVKNGGTLTYENLVRDCEEIMYAEHENKVIGFAGLKYYESFKNGIYVEQIAVAKKCQGMGIGSGLIREAIKYARDNNIEYIYANCKRTNKASYYMFKGLRFEEIEMSKKQYDELEFSDDEILINYALRFKV